MGEAGYPVMFQCQRCGDCCTRPGILTAEDFSRIASHLGVSRLELWQDCVMYDNGIGIKPKLSKETGHCVLMDYEGGIASCRVFAVQPATCRLTPLGFYPSDIVFGVGAGNKCKGYGKGPIVNPGNFIREADAEAIRRFVSEYGHSLSKFLRREEGERYMRLREVGLSPVTHPSLRRRLENFARTLYMVEG